jgi:glycosyltransferase involved in cell wall biosynthesis
MSDSRPYRLAVVNSHPVQYFAPLYAYLTQDPEIEVTALYCSNFSLRGEVDKGFGQAVSWNIDLLKGYKSIFLKGAESATLNGFFSLICPDLWSTIRQGNYHAVIIRGYALAAYLVGFFTAKLSGVPVFMHGETHLGLGRPGWKRWLRDTVLRIAFRYVDAFLAIGSANRAYYRSLGVPDHKIFMVPYTVDNERFIAAAQVARASRRETLTSCGLPVDQPVILYASKFMPRKHPDDLIEAVARLQAKGMTLSLLMVGSGALETSLKQRVQALGLNNVSFTGFVNQAELPKFYAIADVFVLPSESEPWGLIVNEVMCAGLPVVVAEGVGCVADLVTEGVNGALHRPGDVDSLAKALERVLSDGERMAAMGEASLQRIQQWSYRECLEGVRQALVSVDRPSDDQILATHQAAD